MIKRVLIGLLLLMVMCGTATAASTSLTIGVYDVSGNYSAVAGAAVTLSGASTTTLYTSSNGVATFTVDYQKTYTATVTKAGYLTQTASVYINEMPKIESMYLMQESPVAIVVTDSAGNTVSGATVTVDGRTAGTTNANGLVHAAMNRGAYNTIAVSSPSYVQFSQSVYIDNDRTTLPVTLYRAQTTPLVLVYNTEHTPVAGAAVYINDKVVSYSDAYGRAQLPTYTSGTYTLKVEKEGYVTQSKSVVFSVSSADVVVTLNYSAVSVAVRVMDGDKPLSNAVVYVEGDAKGVTNSYGWYTLTEAPGKKIYISASLDGYTGSSVMYEVKADSSNVVDIAMKQNVPTTLIGIGALSIIIVLLIIILLVAGKRKGKRGGKNRVVSSGKRDSL